MCRSAGCASYETAVMEYRDRRVLVPPLERACTLVRRRSGPGVAPVRRKHGYARNLSPVPRIRSCSSTAIFVAQSDVESQPVAVALGLAGATATLTGGLPGMPMGYDQHWNFGMQRGVERG
jgi:hypothetical protein